MSRSDVGHLLEHQVLDLGLGDALERVAGLGVDQQQSPGRSLRGRSSSRGPRAPRRQILRGDQRFGEPDDALLVGVPDHQRPVSVGQHLAQRADLADRFEGAGLHDGQRLVQPDGLAFLRVLVSMLGEQVSRILRPEVKTSTVSSSATPSNTP
jgi:hypothetical protein